MKHTYVSQLPDQVQKKVETEVRKSLQQEGIRHQELEESVEQAMNSRLHDLENTIDIRKITLS